MKFQQYTSALMAKGVEDTSFYRYHRLVSLNDVGGDPLRFGMTPEQFHAEIAERSRSWPDEMVATSTHDSKRSEDVRARINVLSEIPLEWHRKVRTWREMNGGKKRFHDGSEAPVANDEYLFYQTAGRRYGRTVKDILLRNSWREFAITCSRRFAKRRR